MSKGVTLIESLIGLAIISFGVLFVILVFPLVVSSTFSVKKDTTALFLATSKMEKMVTESYSLIEEGSASEDYGDIDEFDNYRREVVVSCFHPEKSCENEETGMKKIKVSVFRKESEGEIISLTSLISKK